jgi:hypothetical protein
MIRNTMLGLSLFALMTGSALAGETAHKHVSKSRTVAAAPAGDTAKEPAKADAPKGDEAAKPEKKKTSKKEKAPKGEAKTEGAKEMKAPAPETK